MSCDNLRDGDIDALKMFHMEQSWPYEFPDLENPEFVVKRAVYDEDGMLVGCVAARKTVELYFLGDKDWRTPRWRLEALKMLHEDVRQKLAKQGFQDGHCWLPPSVENFGRRLMRLGWQENPWKCFSRKVG